MPGVKIRRGLARQDATALLAWANGGGEAFLRQFAGPKWRYPLTWAQLEPERDEIYSILVEGEFAGIIQRFPTQPPVARLGRFLIDPARTGRGIGTAALELLCREIFRDGSVESVSLNVYRFNAQALRCYRKCGFAVVNTWDDEAWPRCEMALNRKTMTLRSNQHDL